MCKSLFFLLLCAIAPLVARAQEDDVVVTLKAVPAWGTVSSTFTLNCLNTANNSLTPSGTTVSSGNASFQARMVPGYTYQAVMTASTGGNANGIKSALLSVATPIGYYAQIANVARSSTTINFNNTSPFSVSVRVLPLSEDLGFRAGIATSLSSSKQLWRLSLGSLPNGRFAGYLSLNNLAGMGSLAQMFSSGNINCDAISSAVKITYTDATKTELRQVVAPEVAVDIYWTGSTLDFYCYPSAAATLGSGGYYTFSCDPFAWYHADVGSDAAGVTMTAKYKDIPSITSTGVAVTRTLTSTLNRTGTSPNYVWNATGWHTSAGNLINQTLAASASGDTATLTDNLGVVALTVNRIFVTSSDPVVSSLPSKIAVGSNNPTNATISYISSVGAIGYGFPQTVTDSTGAALTYSYFDSTGLVNTAAGPFKNTNGQMSTTTTYSADAFGDLKRLASKTTTSTVNGTATTIFKEQVTYTTAVPFSSHPQLKVYTATDTVNTSSTASLQSTTEVFAEDSGVNLGTGWIPTDDFYLNQLYSVTKADGTKQSYFHVRGSWNGSVFSPSTNGGLDYGAYSAMGVISGQTSGTSLTSVTCSSLSGVAVDSVLASNGKATLDLSVRDQAAHVVFTASYIYSGSVWNLVRSTTYTYNLANELTKVQSSTGTNTNVETTTYTYSGEQLQSTTDAAGITTSYTYDAADRVQGATTAGLQTNYTYDAANRILTETVVGTSENLVKSRVYDDAGRLISETNPGLGAVTFTYSYSASGSLVTTNYSDGTNKVASSYIDGHPASISGNAVVAEYLDYVVESDGTTSVSKTMGAINSPRWQKTTSDWAGREIKTIRPNPSVPNQTGSVGQGSFVTTTTFYDAQGRISAVAQDGRASTYYQYDEASQVNRVGLDMGTDGITTTSSDRIVDTSNDIESISGAWWRVSTTTIYPTINSGTSVKASTVQKRLSGFAVGQLEEEQTIDIDNNTSDRSVTVSGSTVTIKVTAPNYQNAQTTTISNGLLTNVTDFDGLQTSYVYDSLKRLSSVKDKRGNTTTATYGSSTTLISQVTDAVSNATKFAYDALGMGRQVSITDSQNQTIYTGYTTRGEVANQWGSGTYPVAYNYNSYGELHTLTTYRSANPSAWSGSTWPTTLPATGDVTTWNYDTASGVLLSKVDASNQKQSFTYNNLGQTATATSARGITTHYSYVNTTSELSGITYDSYTDARGTVSTSPVSYTYNRLGQPATVADAAGTRTFTYNAGTPLRLASETLPSFFNNRTYTPYYEGTTSSTTGTLAGRAVGFTLAASSAELMSKVTISNLGQLTALSSQTNAQTASSFAYTYNTDGTLGKYAIGSFVQSQTYDTQRDLVLQAKATWAGTAITQFDYTYNSIGQRQTIQQSGTAFGAYGGNVFRYNSYNSRGEMQTSAMYNGSATSAPSASAEIPGRRYEYRYDDIGNRTTAGETGTSLVDDAYAANSLNQYTTKQNNVVRVTGTVASGTKAAAYSSDGQIVALSVNGKGFGGDLVPYSASGPATGTLSIYGASNVAGTSHVSSISKNWTFPGAAQAFTYDADGNLISDNINSYFYDAENRLVQITTLSSAVAAGFPNQTLVFKYDYLGRRIEKRVTNAANVTTATRFIYDGWSLIEEIDGNSLNQLKTYTWNGNLIAIQDVVAAKTLYPTVDANGNIAALINASTGTTEAIYEYSPSGELIHAEGTYSSSNPFRFSSEYQDDETGLVYYGLRFYSPSLGRFINRDPIEEQGGLNLYGFCQNDGVNSVDSLGMSQTMTETFNTWLKDPRTGDTTPIDGSVTIDFNLSDWDGTSGGKLLGWKITSISGVATQYAIDFTVTQSKDGTFTFSILNPAKAGNPGYIPGLTDLGTSSANFLLISSTVFSKSFSETPNKTPPSSGTTTSGGSSSTVTNGNGGQQNTIVSGPGSAAPNSGVFIAGPGFGFNSALIRPSPENDRAATNLLGGFYDSIVSMMESPSSLLFEHLKGVSPRLADNTDGSGAPLVDAKSGSYIVGGLYSGVVLGGLTPAAENGVWQMNRFVRGGVIEEALGANLPQNFPTIDRFANGVATSIKSVDLGASSYQNASTLTRLINSYVDKLAAFRGRTWAGVTVDGAQITSRQLQVVVPNAGTAAQQAALAAAAQRAQGMGVQLIVTHFP